MATPPFKYQAPFPMGKDETEYYLLTKDHGNDWNYSVNSIVGELYFHIFGSEEAKVQYVRHCILV